MSKNTCLRCGNIYQTFNNKNGFVNSCGHCTKKFDDKTVEDFMKRFKEFKI